MMQNKRVIAVTGGIGSGKSALTSYLSSYGDVISCDKINSQMLCDVTYLQILKQSFPEAFTPNFDRKKLSEIIFSDAKKREKLNSISHPEILKRMLSAIQGCKNNIVFVEVPLLNETEFSNYFSEIIVVNASNEVRKNRIEQRDGIDEATALKKMKGQKDSFVFPHAKVYTVENNGTLDDLKKVCDRLYTEIFNKQ